MLVPMRKDMLMVAVQMLTVMRSSRDREVLTLMLKERAKARSVIQLLRARYQMIKSLDLPNH